MNKIIFVLAALLLSVSNSQALTIAGTPQNEILYRVNLGRAADVKLLLDKEVSPNHTNDEGVPLLSLAAMRKDPEGINIMTVLLDNGADINGLDSFGQTALFYAARANNEKTAMFLLEHGINYYIIDNNGDIARNIAHREGNDTLMASMDDFVKQQSEKIKKEYEVYNQALQERYAAEKKMIEERDKEQEEANKKEAEEALKTANDFRSQYKKNIEELQKKEKEKRQELVDKRNAPEFEEKLRTLAYQTCAFQYWSFCKSLNQTIEISDDELEMAIDTHYEEINALTKDLVEGYELKKPYVNKVIGSAKKRIFSQLNKMPSKTYRFEHGVGKMGDMNERCTQIAKYWNNAAIGMAVQDEEEGGGQGSIFNNQQNNNINSGNNTNPFPKKKKKKPMR